MNKIMPAVLFAAILGCPDEAVAWMQAVVLPGGSEEPADGVYVRDWPDSYVLGRLYAGQHMHVDSFSPSKEWAWGKAFGSVDACRWVRVANLDITGHSGSGNECSEDRHVGTFARYVWKSPSGTDGVNVTLSREMGVWDNWGFSSPTGPRDNARGTYTQGTVFTARYKTDNCVRWSGDDQCYYGLLGHLPGVSDWLFLWGTTDPSTGT
jgi:hypothetical protein